MRLAKSGKFVQFAYVTTDRPIPDVTNVWTLFWRCVLVTIGIIISIIPILIIEGYEYAQEHKPNFRGISNRIFPNVRLTDDDDVENDGV